VGPALGATPLRAQQPALTREELAFGQVAFAEAVQGPADVRVMRVTLPLGAAAGWHTHPGPATVVVRGELVDYSAAGCRTVFPAGSAILETADTIHDGRNEGQQTRRVAGHLRPTRRSAAGRASPPAIGCRGGRGI
jgi:quercetin dioxygenase-like cupin family protein